MIPEAILDAIKPIFPRKKQELEDLKCAYGEHLMRCGMLSKQSANGLCCQKNWVELLPFMENLSNGAGLV